MAVLITGLGYIGARLAEDLLNQGETVVAVENFFSTPRSALAVLRKRSGLQLVEGSINRPEALNRAVALGPFRAIVHLAAQPSAHADAASPRYTELTNLVGARLTFEAALKAGIDRAVLGSSFKVYGDRLPPIVTEKQSYGELGDLAHVSKIYSEKLAEMFAASRGLRCVAVRLGITYGLGPVMKLDPRFMTVPNRFAQLAAQREELPVHASAGQPAGFIHVQDASAALQAAIAWQPAERYRAVNAVGECATVAEVAKLVQIAAASRGLETSIVGDTGGNGSSVRVGSSLPRALFQPRRRLAESMGEVLDYFMQPAQPLTLDPLPQPRREELRGSL